MLLRLIGSALLYLVTSNDEQQINRKPEILTLVDLKPLKILLQNILLYVY